jgi:hypothetical protein
VHQVNAGSKLPASPVVTFNGRVVVTNADEYEFAVELVAHLNRDAGQYEIEAADIQRKPGGPPVTSEAIRRLPLLRILRDYLTSTTDYLFVLNESDQDEIVEEVRDGRVYPVPRRARELGQGRPTDEALQYVRFVYLVALVRAESPTKSVSDAFGLAPRTASHWVKLARDRGFI